MNLLAALLLLAAPAGFEGQISARGSHACWLRADHRVVCWGLDLVRAPAETPTGEPRQVPGLDDAQEIAVGTAHACAIRAGGQVVCWGWAGLGQLGAPPEKVFHEEPQPVSGLADAVHLASASNRTCAVRKDGTLACWGSWDANVAHAPQLKPIAGVEHATAIAMSDVHGCALVADGHVICWGDDSRGELGDGVRDPRRFGSDQAVQVHGLEDAVAIAAARLDTCALRKTGQVVCWGDRSGTFAPPEARSGGPFALSPVPVPGATDAKALLLTDDDGCLLRAKNGRLACWWSSLGSWATKSLALPKARATRATDVKVRALANVVQLASGEERYALLADGGLLHWGGRGARRPDAEVHGIADAVQVSTGVNQSCAVRANGTVWCWGATGSGLLSSGTFAPFGSRFSPVPVAVAGVKHAVSVSTGAAHACALDRQGAVWCWGSDAAGQLGNGKKDRGLTAAMRKRLHLTDPVPPPELLPRGRAQRVKLPAKALQVAAGATSTCAVLESGAVVCWGAGDHGQLGNGKTEANLEPTAVTGLEHATRIALGAAAACAIAGEGAVFCWGRDALALTAEGKPSSDLLVPTRVPNVKDAVDLAIAGGAVCAALRDGTVRCWGHRSRYLGDGDPATRGAAIVPVKDLADARAVVAGPEHRCVIRADGHAGCWGHNLAGQLGDGTRVDRLAPQEVVGLKAVRSLSAGEDQSCAVRADGHVVCWGAYASGGLGDGVDPSAPRKLELDLDAAAPPAQVAKP